MAWYNWSVVVLSLIYSARPCIDVILAACQKHHSCLPTSGVDAAGKPGNPAPTGSLLSGIGKPSPTSVSHINPPVPVGVYHIDTVVFMKALLLALNPKTSACSGHVIPPPILSKERENA
jgi:hypothetical protein